MLAELLLDLIFGVDRRLRERQRQIEEAHERRTDETRRKLWEEFLQAEKDRKAQDDE